MPLPQQYYTSSQKSNNLKNQEEYKHMIKIYKQMFKKQNQQLFLWSTV